MTTKKRVKVREETAETKAENNTLQKTEDVKKNGVTSHENDTDVGEVKEAIDPIGDMEAIRKL
jgi:hypothetical protein